MKQVVLFALLLIPVALLAANSPAIPKAHGSVIGLVCLADPTFFTPGTANACPQSPVVFTGPNSPNNQLKIAVNINASDIYLGFDITLRADHTILKPADADLTGSILSGSSASVKCIGGVQKVGMCSPTDTADTVHFGATQSILITNNGLLFTATYNLTAGQTSGVSVGFQRSCGTPQSPTSVPPDVCVTMINGSLTPTPETAQEASFSNQTPALISTDPSFIANLSLLPGQQVAFRVNLTGSSPINGFRTTSTYNTTILKGTGLDYSNSIFGTAPSVTADCIDGKSVSNPQSGACPPGDGPGIVDVSLSTPSGQLVTQTSGPLFKITFSVLSVGVSPFHFTLVALFNGSFTRSPVQPIDGFFSNKQCGTLSGNPFVCQPTIADFTVTPPAPQVGTLVLFNATASRSPNPSASVVTYTWDWDEAGLSLTNIHSPITNQAFNGVYNHIITLTVTDSYGVPGITSRLVSVTPPPPGFSITASPSVLTVPQGSTGFSSIRLSAPSGFTDTVKLTAQVSPAGPTASLSPSTVTFSPTSIPFSSLSVSTTSTTPIGHYNVNVTGTGNTGSHSVLVQVTVVVPPPPDFQITAAPNFLVIPAGTNMSTTVTVTSLLGFSGMVHLDAAILFPGPNVPPPLPTVSLNPANVMVTAGGTATSTVTVSTLRTTPQISYILMVSASSGAIAHSLTPGITVQVAPPPDLPPIAAFTFSPSSPGIGQIVNFDGSSSSDPDGTVISWSWSFGDGSFSFGTFTNHAYSVPGNYMVTLTVLDNAGLPAIKILTVPVHARPLHDVSVINIDVFPRVAVSTQIVRIQVDVANDGLSDERVNVTAYFNSRPIQTISGVFVPGQNCFFFCEAFVQIQWDTTGVQPGNYTISATVSLPNDPTPADNSLTDGRVQILPPPTITVTPTSGVEGTKVLVQGSNFPTPEFSFQGFIQVSFDDTFIGFTFSHNGQFNFTFDVQHAQPGPHLVKAVEQFSGVHAATTFQMLPTPGSLAVTVDTGAIYFPGDSVIVYVLTSQSGIPVGPASLQLQLILIRPDGSNITVSTVPVATGLFKASFTIPPSSSIGTYTLLARARLSSLEATTLRSFEVKPTWLSSHGGTLAAAGTTLGLVGLVVAAWRKGYFRTKKEDQGF